MPLTQHVPANRIWCSVHDLNLKAVHEARVQRRIAAKERAEAILRPTLYPTLLADHIIAAGDVNRVQDMEKDKSDRGERPHGKKMTQLDHGRIMKGIIAHDNIKANSNPAGIGFSENYIRWDDLWVNGQFCKKLPEGLTNNMEMANTNPARTKKADVEISDLGQTPKKSLFDGQTQKKLRFDGKAQMKLNGRYDAQSHMNMVYDSQNQMNMVYDSQNQMNTGYDSQNQMNTGYDNQNQMNTGYDSQNQMITGYDSRNQMNTGYDSQNQMDARYDSQNQMNTGYEAHMVSVPAVGLPSVEERVELKDLPYVVLVMSEAERMDAIGLVRRQYEKALNGRAKKGFSREDCAQALKLLSADRVFVVGDKK